MSLMARKSTRVKLSFRSWGYLMKQAMMKSDPMKLNEAHTCAAANRASCSLELKEEETMVCRCATRALRDV